MGGGLREVLKKYNGQRSRHICRDDLISVFFQPFCIVTYPKGVNIAQQLD